MEIFVLSVIGVLWILSFVQAHFSDKKKPEPKPPKEIESPQAELYRKGHEYLVGDHW